MSNFILFCKQKLVTMQTINASNYLIVFNENGYKALNDLIKKNKYSSIFIIADENSNEHCVSSVLAAITTDILIEIIEIEAGEILKNIITCTEIWSILTDMGADRKSVIINIGGGVITDIGGFVASTFKRGIDFINIPTTLLAMVDASIGGKNGVDLGTLKNQIGTIVNPKMVVINSVFLSSLPKEQMLSGFAEMLKHGLIFDKLYWKNCSNYTEINFEQLDDLIHRSIEIKNEIVTLDPYENGTRKSLNFGHTLGHAIESHFLESQNPLLHGEAIAIGMILESYIAKEKKILSEYSYFEIKKTLKTIYKFVVFSAADIISILDLLIHDKKNEYGKIQFVLLNEIGRVKLNQFVDNQLINTAFNDYKLD